MKLFVVVSVLWVGAERVRASEKDAEDEISPFLTPCDVNGAKCGLCFRDVPSVLAFEMNGLAEDGVFTLSAENVNGIEKFFAVSSCARPNASSTAALIADAVTAEGPTKGNGQKAYNGQQVIDAAKDASNPPASVAEPYLAGGGYCHPEGNNGPACTYLESLYTDSGSDPLLEVDGIILDSGKPAVRIYLSNEEGCLPGLCGACQMVVLVECTDGGGTLLRKNHAGSEDYEWCVELFGENFADRCNVCLTVQSEPICNYQPCVSDSSCSGHGICQVGSGECECDPDWAGFQCSESPECMEAGGCDEHATCKFDASNKAVCTCKYPGWDGDGQECHPYIPPRQDIDGGGEPFPLWAVIAVACVTGAVLMVCFGLFFMYRFGFGKRKSVSASRRRHPEHSDIEMHDQETAPLN